MESRKDIHIYFDMDGVLADFAGGVKKLCHYTPRPQFSAARGEDLELWDHVRTVDHFYRKLDPLPGAQRLFSRVYELYGDRCQVLTGIPGKERGIVSAGEDKIEWMHRFFSPDVIVNITYKEKKPLYCKGPSCILIDDFEENIRNWESAGGCGVLYENAQQTLAALKERKIL